MLSGMRVPDLFFAFLHVSFLCLWTFYKRFCWQVITLNFSPFPSPRLSWPKTGNWLDFHGGDFFPAPFFFFSLFFFSRLVSASILAWDYSPFFDKTLNRMIGFFLLLAPLHESTISPFWFNGYTYIIITYKWYFPNCPTTSCRPPHLPRLPLLSPVAFFFVPFSWCFLSSTFVSSFSMPFTAALITRARRFSLLRVEILSGTLEALICIFPFLSTEVVFFQNMWIYEPPHLGVSPCTPPLHRSLPNALEDPIFRQPVSLSFHAVSFFFLTPFLLQSFQLHSEERKFLLNSFLELFRFSDGSFLCLPSWSRILFNSDPPSSVFL